MHLYQEDRNISETAASLCKRLTIRRADQHSRETLQLLFIEELLVLEPCVLQGHQHLTISALNTTRTWWV